MTKHKKHFNENVEASLTQPADFEEKYQKYHDQLQYLLIRNKKGDVRVGDDFRIIALQTTLGNLLLNQDSVAPAERDKQ